MDIAFQGKITRASGYGLVESVRKIHLLASDEYLGGLGGIHSSHHDAGRELVATHYGLRIWNDKGIQGIDADILHVDIGNQRMEHGSLSIAHVVLQLAQQGDGSCHRHILEQVFLPVLAHRLGC